jgi:hypothetical protein
MLKALLTRCACPKVGIGEARAAQVSRCRIVCETIGRSAATG